MRLFQLGSLARVVGIVDVALSLKALAFHWVIAAGLFLKLCYQVNAPYMKFCIAVKSNAFVFLDFKMLSDSMPVYLLA